MSQNKFTLIREPPLLTIPKTILFYSRLNLVISELIAGTATVTGILDKSPTPHGMDVIDPPEQPNPLAPATAEPEEETVDETSTLLTEEFTASQVTALRGEFGSSSIKWVMAKLTESPANWHQTTVFVCTSDNPEDRRERWWLFLGSIMMVLFQCAAAIGALRNTQNRSCANNEQCDAVMGMYCEDFTFQDLGGRKKSIGGTGIKQANRCTY